MKNKHAEPMAADGGKLFEYQKVLQIYVPLLQYSSNVSIVCYVVYLPLATPIQHEPMVQIVRIQGSLHSTRRSQQTGR